MKRKVRSTPKGRAVDAKALAEVQALLGDAPRRRDLLIEHLHKINDRYGHLSAAHLAALAEEMQLSLTEVYEVATFYHHFDVVKEGETPPPALTVRVCDSIACELAGSENLLSKLPSLLGREVRVLHAPCVGRCEVAPCVVVGQNPVGNATRETVQQRGFFAKHRVRGNPVRRLCGVQEGGRLQADRRLPRRQAHARRDHQDHGGLRPARPGRRRLPGRPQVEPASPPSPSRA